jgi:hypothetical protein
MMFSKIVSFTGCCIRISTELWLRIVTGRLGRCIKTHIPVVEHLCVVKSFGCYVLATWQQKLESKYTILTNLLEDHRHEGDGWSEKQPKDCLHQHFEVQKNSSTVSCSSES